MIITIMTWLIMWLIFSINGIAFNLLIKKLTQYSRHNVFDNQWIGIMMTTVYAQFFSLIYKVGLVALIIVLAIVFVLVLLLKKEYLYVVNEKVAEIKRYDKRKYAIVILALSTIVFIGCLFTIQQSSHYDTYLYHAQNLRWIEEYGVVKGLGNFHNRFAYNSSFMCLQALFSFSWCLDNSLHTLNGFLWVFMLWYAVGTLKVYKKNGVFLSDIFKFLIVTYLLNDEVIGTLSSPHTDMMTMLLVIYIITRWVEYLEEEERSVIPYGMLCLLGVFAVSVKLSAALVLILVLKPAIQLLKNEEWKVIIGFVTSGIIIILPFVLRNIILSGYLVYPYASIDLFNVDWKMPASQVVFDNHEIIAWGRMLNDVDRYLEPITVWLPIWLERSGTVNRTFMFLNLFLLPIMLGTALYNLYKKNYDRSLIIICCSVLFCGWLFTAPLPRYGRIYMYLLPLIFLFLMLQRIHQFVLRGWKYIVYACFLIVTMAIMPQILDGVTILKYGNRLFPEDYEEYSVNEVIWNDLEVYLPDGGDQVSYHSFPSTPYPARLELIELRGEGLKDGFRIREEYRGREISTYGYFLD